MTHTTALRLAADAVPVLPLREGKVPFGNCPACAKNACGGRPNMKTAGPCACPRPCHGWAAATTDPPPSPPPRGRGHGGTRRRWPTTPAAPA